MWLLMCYWQCVFKCAISGEALDVLSMVWLYMCYCGVSFDVLLVVWLLICYQWCDLKCVIGGVAMNVLLV